MKPSRTRTGAIYVEVVLACVVFSFSVAFLGASVVSQERLLHALEHRVYILKPAHASVTASLSMQNGLSTATASQQVLLPPDPSSVPSDPYFRSILEWADLLGARGLSAIDGRSDLGGGTAPMFGLWDICPSHFDALPDEPPAQPPKTVEILGAPVDDPGPPAEDGGQSPPREWATSLSIRVTG